MQQTYVIQNTIAILTKDDYLFNISCYPCLSPSEKGIKRFELLLQLSQNCHTLGQLFCYTAMYTYIVYSRTVEHVLIIPDFILPLDKKNARLIKKLKRLWVCYYPIILDFAIYVDNPILGREFLSVTLLLIKYIHNILLFIQDIKRPDL